MTRDELQKAGFKELSVFREPSWVSENVNYPIQQIRVVVRDWDGHGFSRFYSVFAECIIGEAWRGTIVLHHQNCSLKESIAVIERLLGINS